MNERNFERESEQAMKVSFVKKNKNHEWLEDEKKNVQNPELSPSEEKKQKEFQNCNRFGHFAFDCWSNIENKCEEVTIGK